MTESDSDSKGKDEDKDDDDGGEDDNELTLTQAGEWNDFDIVAAAVSRDDGSWLDST